MFLESEMRMTRRKGLEEERGMERDEGVMIGLVLPFEKEKKEKKRKKSACNSIIPRCICVCVYNHITFL